MFERVNNTEPRGNEQPDERDQVLALQKKVLELAGELTRARRLVNEETAKRKQLEESLESSEAKYRLIVEHAKEGVFLLQDGRIRLTNPSGIEMLGRSEAEVYAGPFTDFVFPDDREEVFRNYQRILGGEELPARYSFRVLGPEGPPLWLEVDPVRVVWEGRPGVMAFAVDVSKRKKAERELRDNQRRLELALEAGQLALWDWNIRSGEMLFSPRMAAMLGYAPGEIAPHYTAWGKLVHPDDHTAIRKAFNAHVKGREPNYESEHRLRHKSGKWIWNLARGMVVEWDNEGNPVRMIGINYDVTERKSGVEQLKSSLKEKEVMLQEIHHRVKNNLAVVSSLVSLQSDYATDDRHKQMFEDTQNRIRSMALAHEMLYQTDSLAELDISEYLGNLIDHLATSVASVTTDVTITKDIEDIRFTLDTVIPLGSMVTELVSNSLKHAFPNGRQGRITISLRAAGNSRFELIVSDDGIGMPCDTGPNKPKSLGLDLIRIFVRQIRGEMEFSGDNGTEVRIIFQDAKPRITDSGTHRQA